MGKHTGCSARRFKPRRPKKREKQASQRTRRGKVSKNVPKKKTIIQDGRVAVRERGRCQEYR